MKTKTIEILLDKLREMGYPDAEYSPMSSMFGGIVGTGHASLDYYEKEGFCIRLGQGIFEQSEAINVVGDIMKVTSQMVQLNNIIEMLEGKKV